MILVIGYDIYDCYNGAFSIASKNDLDDQNLLLATVQCCRLYFECELRCCGSLIKKQTIYRVFQN
jgi:hypothetical protein